MTVGLPGALVVAPVVALVVALVQAAPAGAAVACGPPPAGMASVAVVVDTGSGDPLVRCTTVKEGATGRDALLAAAVPFRVGSGTPADNNQGGAFLCGLLGVPQSGCAAPSSKGYSYWAYYRQPASSPWTYSRVGFFTPVGSRCWVEGWRYTTAGGVAATDNPRPRVAPPAVSCQAPVVTSAPVAPAVTAPAPSPAAPAPAARAPSSSAPAAGASSAATPSTTPSVVAAPAVPDAEVAGRTTVASSAPEADGRVTTRSATADDGSRELAAGEPAPQGGGVPWVAVGAVLAALLIGLGTAVRRRRLRA